MRATPMPPAADSTAVARTLLLVAAASPAVAELERSLRAHGMHVQCASKADAALAACERGGLDAALVDLDMTDCDGLTLVGYLWRALPDLPVMTYGSVERPVRSEAARRAGVVSHFSGAPDADAVVMAARLALDQGLARPHALARKLMATSTGLAVLATQRHDNDHFLEEALRHLMQHFGADRGSLFLVERGCTPPTLRARASHGIDRALLKDVMSGAGVTGRVFVSGRGQLILSDLAQQPGFEQCKPVVGVTASMSVPVRHASDIIGVVNISSLQPHTVYTPRDLEACEFLAAYLAEMLRQSEVLAAQAQLREQLNGVERLALAGELTASIAHEIKNPLAFMRTNLNALRDYVQSVVPLAAELERAKGAGELSPVMAELARDAELNGLANDGLPVILECLEGIERCMTIIRDLKAMVRQDATAEQGEVQLAEVVEQALKLTRTRIAQRARVLKAVEPGLTVHGNAVQLVQVLVNLLNNAGDAIDDRAAKEPQAPHGEITIECRREGETVQLAVRDNGCGMPPAVQARAFQPLFTTKARDVGTGLGLGIVRRIVGVHGGTIVIDSVEDQGTTMRVTLPLLGLPVLALGGED